MLQKFEPGLSSAKLKGAGPPFPTAAPEGGGGLPGRGFSGQRVNEGRRQCESSLAATKLKLEAALQK